jgi:CDP-paratose 2-epimerase
MKVLITGICGFVGFTIARAIRETGLDWTLLGLDNLGRPGAELNRSRLKALGAKLHHGDLRCQSDVDSLPPVDWIIDAAAQPSVLAGADGQTSSRQLMEHNLMGTIHLLEKCKRDRAGFLLLSTSRVYAIEPLATLPVEVREGQFVLNPSSKTLPLGVTAEGVTEAFSTAAPVSLYGASKLASEALALEYGQAFDFPVWINRCGVMAGGGQFGRADQGIFAYWIHSHRERAGLRYIGFDGFGHQVRDCLHPRDLVPLLRDQFETGASAGKPRIINVSGGRSSATSLRQLTLWCDARFGSHPVGSDPRPRAYDLPWVVLDSSRAEQVWGWRPQTTVEGILDEIAQHAQSQPDWLAVSAPD